MDAELIGCLTFSGVFGVFFAGFAIAWRVREGRRYAATWDEIQDECMVCDEFVERNGADYACSACGYDTSALAEGERARFLDLLSDLKTAHDSSKRAAFAGTAAARLQYATGSVQRSRFNDAWQEAHSGYSDALAVLDRVTRELPDLLPEAISLAEGDIGTPDAAETEFQALADGVGEARRVLRALCGFDPAPQP